MSDKTTAATIRQIARKIARWASHIADIDRGCGYCMSGSWSDFYASLLLPDRRLNAEALTLLVESLGLRGYDASLHITPFKDATGIFMYMRLRRLA